jgi:hypothetical protein
MRIHHFITAGMLVMAAVFAASCAKSPDKPTESIATIVSGNANAAPASHKPSEPVMSAGSINIIGIELSQFLPFYAALADAQLDTSELGTLPPIIIRFTNTNAVTRAEAVRLLDAVLYDQAGIVATHPDAKHVILKYRSSGNAK